MDKAVLDFFQSVVQPNNPLTYFLYGITAISEAGIIWILLAVAFLFHPRTRTMGVAMGLALICMLVINNLAVKNLIARPRPYVQYPLEILIPRLSSYSFPSGHTASSFAASVCMVWYSRKWGIPALIVAAIVAFSRVYFSVHFLTDVLGGVAFGVVYAGIGIWYSKLFWPKHHELLKKRFGKKQA